MDETMKALHELWGLYVDNVPYSHEIKDKFGKLQFAIEKERRDKARVGTRWVEWAEPFGPNCEPAYKRCRESTAIAAAHKVALEHNYTYKSDDEALADFMVVHWASFCPEEPRNDIRWAAWADLGDGDTGGLHAGATRGLSGVDAVGRSSYMAADDAAVLSGRPLSDRDAASALAEELDCIYVEKEDFYLMRCADEPQFGATPIPRRLWKRLVELRKLGDVKEMR